MIGKIICKVNYWNEKEDRNLSVYGSVAFQEILDFEESSHSSIHVDDKVIQKKNIRDIVAFAEKDHIISQLPHPS
jgi:hypothetical protein